VRSEGGDVWPTVEDRGDGGDVAVDGTELQVRTHRSLFSVESGSKFYSASTVLACERQSFSENAFFYVTLVVLATVSAIRSEVVIL